jgi:hypoxia up-regulated 1
MRLAHHFAKLFKEKTKKDLFKNSKATLKIYKEADRIKNILSANVDHMAQVEGLMDEVDFKAKATREEFEKMCSDLFDRIKKTIEEAIKSAEITHVCSFSFIDINSFFSIEILSFFLMNRFNPH